MTVTWLFNESAVSGHELELHLLVALPEFLRHVSIADRHPARDRGAQLLGQDGLAELLLELAGGERRVLHREQLPVARLADELAVLHERRQREDALPHLDVTHREVLLARLGHHRLLVDERLQDLLVDAELTEHLLADLAAVGVPVLLELRVVAALELGNGDALPLDVGQHGIGRDARRGDVAVGHEEESERNDEDGQAPFEPATVPPHPVERGHG